MTEHNINAAIQIVPRSEDKNIYGIIDQAIEVIQQSGLKYEITPMETVIEGPYNKVFQIIKEAQEAALSYGAYELLVNIKLHIRKDGDVTFEEKTGKYR